MTFKGSTIAAAAACLWLPAVPAAAQWPRCAADLDALRAAAEEAHEASSMVASLEASLLETRDSYTRCRQDLDVFRIDRDTSPIRAAVQRDECNQQVQAYQTTERRYTSEMDRVSTVFRTLAAAVQVVELSCQYPLAAYAPAQPPDEAPAQPPASAPSPACERFLGNRPGVPIESLRVLCSAEMSEDECAACLGPRR